MAGEKVAVATGQTVTFGRAAGRAQFALAHDTFMSGVHFAVECGPRGCRVQDRKSSNGTFLNGARIQDAMLANGDEIKSGQTIFAVKVVADAKLASSVPPQEVAPPAASQQRPRPFEPALPAALESGPLAAEPAPPQVPPSARFSDEPKPVPLKAAPQPSPPSRVPVEPPARKSEPAAEPAARKFSRAQEPPAAEDLPLRPEAPARSVLPPLEEPPKFHAIPTPPGVGAKPRHAGEDPPRVGEQALREGENPPGADANPRNSRDNPPRSGEPRAGVAPYIAQKFADLPASRGGVSPRGAAFSVMGWSFPPAPAEWQVQEGFGLQQTGHEEFPSSVAVTEELLGGITLQQFVESQISMLRGYLRNPKIEPTMPPKVGGADESMAMDVRHSTKDGRELVYRRIYARSGSSVGVLTVTTLAADFPQVLETLQPLLDGAAFRATVNN